MIEPIHSFKLNTFDGQANEEKRKEMNKYACDKVN